MFGSKKQKPQKQEIDWDSLTPAERRRLKRKQKHQEDMDFIDFVEGVDAMMDDDYL